MSGYSNLLHEIDNLRDNVAIFRKVVLHSHSTDSHDYGKSSMDTDLKDKYINTEEEYSDALLHSRLHMISVTDHMKCRLACKLSESTISGGVCILPGMEINFRLPTPLHTSKLHLLVIFPEKCSHEQICKILPPKMADEKNRKGSEEIEGNISDFVKMVHECGGLCIAAHIDSNNGIRHTFRQLGHNGIVFYAEGQSLTPERERRISEQFKDWLLLSGIDAIEVAKDQDKEHYSWMSELEGQRKTVAVLLKGDRHRIEEIEDEDSVNHIKMTAICHNDLQQALRFPDTRIRFPKDVPKPPSSKLLGMEIVSAGEEGFFQELKVAFSDNLTCLIGPRGSGKSAIIEAIRYSFGLNRRLNELKQAGEELAEKAKSLQRATLTNSIIRIVYLDRDGLKHIVETTFDPKQDCTSRFFDENGEEKEIFDIESSYPLRLFGWSELETLGREAYRQRDLLDRLISEFTETIEKRSRLRADLKQKRKVIESAIIGLESVFERDGGEIKKYGEYKSDFDKLNTEEIKNLFRDLDEVKAKIVILKKLKDNSQKWFGELVNMNKEDSLEGVDDIVKTYNEHVKIWWEERKPTYEERQTEVLKDISEGIKILSKIIEELDSELEEFKQEQSEKERKLKEEVGEEAATQVATELRRRAAERLDEVQTLKREYEDKWKEFLQLLDKWKLNTKAINETQAEISSKREKRKEEIEQDLNRFSSPEMKISIRFESGRDRKQFEDYLTEKGILNKQAHGYWRKDLWPLRISLVCTPIEMAEAILENDSSKITRILEIQGQKIGVDESMANILVSTLHPFSRDEDADEPVVDKLKIINILEIAEVEWDDLEGILLNDKPVERCSPGQRSSAMLPLITLAEDVPLIIDQPEDNLDNRLVGKMLVDIFTGLKEKRQIIVATHNPNIVVSGDAEQVIVLDALSDSEGTCTVSGSIDKKEIVTSVIELMEGGREAFITRSIRYGLRT